MLDDFEAAVLSLVVGDIFQDLRHALIHFHKFIIVVDDKTSDRQGNLAMTADLAITKSIAFMIMNTSEIILVGSSPVRCASMSARCCIYTTITNLPDTVFGELWRLELLAVPRKM